MVFTVVVFFSRLHERLGEEDQAASAYTEYINEANRMGVSRSQ